MLALVQMSRYLIISLPIMVLVPSWMLTHLVCKCRGTHVEHPPFNPKMRALLKMQIGKKRQAKNDKFGFGGRKRLKKQNNASSAADMDSFRQGRFHEGPRRFGASGGLPD